MQKSISTPPLKTNARQTTKIIKIEKAEVNHPILLKYLNLRYPVLKTQTNERLERINPTLINTRAIPRIVNDANA